MTKAEAAHLIHPHLRPLRCAWLGPTSGGLAWLRQRLHDAAVSPTQWEFQHYPAISLGLLRTLVDEGGLDRIILACSTRLDYPVREIEFLQRDCPDVPLAVACESWWDGARRTGLGNVDHLSLPWYRWWDGWTVWLEGRVPELFGPCQQSVAPWVQAGGASLATPCRLDDCGPPTAKRAIIVGNCRPTCAAWSLVAESCGLPVAINSWQKFQQRLAAEELDARVQWILWDDSCLNTSGSKAGQDPTLESFFRRTRQALPTTWLIAAVSLPRADEWSTSSVAERRELIVKPDSGQALTRLLMHIQTVDNQTS